MRDFVLPPRCEFEIYSSEVVHSAKLAERQRCGLRHVFCGFMLIVSLHFVKEISFNRNMKTKNAD